MHLSLAALSNLQTSRMISWQEASWILFLIHLPVRTIMLTRALCLILYPWSFNPMSVPCSDLIMHGLISVPVLQFSSSSQCQHPNYAYFCPFTRESCHHWRHSYFSFHNTVFAVRRSCYSFLGLCSFSVWCSVIGLVLQFDREIWPSQRGTPTSTPKKSYVEAVIVSWACSRF